MTVMYRLIAITVLCIPLVADDAILDHTRQVNLELASHMPNFVAHEVVRQYFDRKGERDMTTPSKTKSQ